MDKNVQFEAFRGRDLPQAIAAVRAAFGQNAIIASTRTVSNGKPGALGNSFVEVRAAAGDDVLNDPFATRSGERGAAQRPSQSAKPPSSATAQALARSAQAKSDLGGIDAELRALRALVEEMVSTKKPRDRALGMVNALGFEGALAADLSGGAAKASRGGTRELQTRLRERIGAKLRIAASPIDEPGPRIVACIGPTGVGKTTTLAKLAARAHLGEGRNVAIVTLDTFRVGAVEQMRRFADLMGLPFDVAQDAAQFREALRDRAADLVLVDTPSRSPSDDRALTRLIDCLGAGGNRAVDVLLALPASIRSGDAARLMKGFQRCEPTAVVLTKLDETAHLGGALQATIEGEYPIAYLCDGPRVPEDLRDASVEPVLDALFPADRSA